MIQGFKDFIMRGNVIDLAVAVVIGAAFTGLVTAFTEKVVQPLVESVRTLGETSVFVLDGTVVFVALPRIQDAMHLSDAAKIWVFGAYAVTFGGFMLLGGRLGDTFGRKRMFILGVAGFTFASLLTGFATNEAWLLVARAAQGLFAAIACPTALALIATTFAPGKARNQAFAIFGAMAGLGSVSGLVAGGLLAT